jgi:hypothetical protein
MRDEMVHLSVDLPNTVYVRYQGSRHRRAYSSLVLTQSEIEASPLHTQTTAFDALRVLQSSTDLI